MVRKSRREIERDVEDMSEDSNTPDLADVSVVVCYCENKTTCEHADMETIADFTGVDT